MVRFVRECNAERRCMLHSRGVSQSLLGRCLIACPTVVRLLSDRCLTAFKPLAMQRRAKPRIALQTCVSG